LVVEIRFEAVEAEKRGLEPRRFRPAPQLRDVAVLVSG
jgi:hypothetical protein